jgi:signal transduction histidine kinase
MKSLRGQLILSHIVPLLILLPLLGLLLLYIVETQIVLSSLTDELAREAAVLAEIAGQQTVVFENQNQGQVFAQAAGAQFEHNVALLQEDGTEWAVIVEGNVLASVQPTASELDALADGQGQTRAAFNPNPSLVTVQALAPVLDPQRRLVGIVRVTEYIDRVYARLTQMRVLILGATLAALLVAVGIGAFLANRTARQLDSVTSAITGVAYGSPITLKSDAMPREFGAPLDAVSDLQKRLQESEMTRKRLLANLVHELGRPLGALQAAIHALRQGADQDPTLRDELLQGMDAQVERLKPLLDNLASLHGGLSGALELQRTPVNLNEWLPKTIVTWREAAEQKGLLWQQEIPPDLPTVSIDANRMAQALGNLLSNAIKYTPEGGTITVSAGQQDKKLLIAVQDTGIGISPKDRAHIFDPLYRGSPARTDAPNRFPQGMGLGLAIARDVVTAHRGQIEVESTVGEGSKFRIVLPT